MNDILYSQLNRFLQPRSWTSYIMKHVTSKSSQTTPRQISIYHVISLAYIKLLELLHCTSKQNTENRRRELFKTIKLEKRAIKTTNGNTMWKYNILPHADVVESKKQSSSTEKKLTRIINGSNEHYIMKCGIRYLQSLKNILRRK